MRRKGSEDTCKYAIKRRVLNLESLVCYANIVFPSKHPQKLDCTFCYVQVACSLPSHVPLLECVHNSARICRHIPQALMMENKETETRKWKCSRCVCKSLEKTQSCVHIAARRCPQLQLMNDHHQWTEPNLPASAALLVWTERLWLELELLFDFTHDLQPTMPLCYK